MNTRPMTLMICPIRPGERNEELKFALRSWETHLHLGGDLALATIGACPTWLAPDYHIEGNRFSSGPVNVYDNVLIASQWAAEGGHELALYMNDDFFCLDPVGAVLPVKRDISLAAHLRMAGSHRSHWWPKSLALTASWLAGEGFPHPDSYEVHRPLLAPPDAMFTALARWWDQEFEHSGGIVPQWRTLYGTLNEVEAYPVSDSKMGTDYKVGVGTPWVSTSDNSWLRYGPSIRKRFQKPSRWER